MKKTWKRLCTGFLALATVVTALPTTPVHAESKQYWTESAERVGIIEKVMNDGSIGSTFNEGYMKVEGETAYCIDINTNFKNGYKTRADASSRMSADQISDVALSLDHPLLLVLHLPIQLSAPLCPGSVFRSAQELLDHPDPRLRDLHLFPRLGIGPALRVCLVAELGNAVLRPLNRVDRMEQIAVANSQRAQQRLIRFRGVQRLLIGFFCPHVGKSAAQFTALLFKESNDLLS